MLGVAPRVEAAFGHWPLRSVVASPFSDVLITFTSKHGGTVQAGRVMADCYYMVFLHGQKIKNILFDFSQSA